MLRAPEGENPGPEASMGLDQEGFAGRGREEVEMEPTRSLAVQGLALSLSDVEA